MNNEGCPGCFESARGQAIELETAIKEAKAYAKEKEKSMAIYKEGSLYLFIDAFYAYEQGYPVIKVVSGHSDTSPVQIY